MHANRAWHLDISPDNVMIRATDGAPILLDFGASRFEIKQHSQLVSALVFKSGYSAPEQYTSNADRYGPWTDIYAFAATLYRAISGTRPIEATSRQLADELRPAVLVGKGRYRDKFLKAIDWALKLPPQDRPQSIPEWRKNLLEGGGAPVAMAKTRVLSARTRIVEGGPNPLPSLRQSVPPARKFLDIPTSATAAVAALGCAAVRRRSAWTGWRRTSASTPSPWCARLCSAARRVGCAAPAHRAGAWWSRRTAACSPASTSRPRKRRRTAP